MGTVAKARKARTVDLLGDPVTGVEPRMTRAAAQAKAATSAVATAVQVTTQWDDGHQPPGTLVCQAKTSDQYTIQFSRCILGLGSVCPVSPVHLPYFINGTSTPVYRVSSPFQVQSLTS